MAVRIVDAMQTSTLAYSGLHSPEIANLATGGPQLRLLLPLVLLNLSLDLVRLGLQLVTECLQFIGALTLSFCSRALRFCEAENTLCLSHEVLDVFLGKHSVPYLSTRTELSDACGQSLGR